MYFEYPVKLSSTDTQNETSEEAKARKAEVFYGHRNQFGFYPIGRLNTWHGGIHIEQSAAITAIADGRIIAYRFSEDYIQQDQEDKKQSLFSNNFILLQHKYSSPKQIELRFYSLYMHLAPKKDLEKSGKVPDIFAKFRAKVTGQNRMRGLNARSGSCTNAKGLGDKLLVIPLGATVKLDPLPPASKEVYDPYSMGPKKTTTIVSPFTTTTHWTDNYPKLAYKRVRYEDDQCRMYQNVYVATSGNRVVEVGKNELRIITEEDPIDTKDANYVRGANVYDKPDLKNNRYLWTLAQETEPFEVEIVSKTWCKIIGKEHYILRKDLTIDKVLNESFLADGNIQNVDIAIKGGSSLGYTGRYGFSKQEFYRAVHVEVFTDDSGVKDFIENNQDKKETHTAKKGSVLKSEQPCTILKKDINVRIYKTDENYVQIGFEDVFTEVPDKDLYLENVKKESVYVEGRIQNKYTYTIKESYFDEVNTAMNMRLATQESRVYYIAKTGKAKKGRKIGYGTQYSGRKFWVKRNEVTGTEGQWTTLAQNIEWVFDQKPSPDQSDIILTKDCSVRKKTDTKDSSGTQWWQVSTKEGEGWIQKDELRTQNAFCWKDFGWQIEEDTGDQYVYQFNTKNGEEPHAFIKKIWDLVDLPEEDGQGDKELTRSELQRAFRDPQKVGILSKLICKHQNEWDYKEKYVTFEMEVKKVFQKGIDQEEDNERKQILVQSRDRQMELLKEKIEYLCFWQEVKDGEVSQDTSQKERPFKRTFPTSNSTVVYHFHPIAFVEHMKLIYSRDGKHAPWMEIAINEAKKAKFIKETLSPTFEMANKYHTYVGLPKATGSTAWCSSFVSWCLNEVGQKNAKAAGSQSVLWNEGKLFKRIEKPIYGCIVLMTNYVKSTGKSNSHGHVTFLYGVDSNGDLICLGGNQGDRLKYSRYYTHKVNHTFTQKSVKVEQKFNGFFLPMDYSEKNSKQPEVADMKKLNNELAGKIVKSNTNNEKTT